MRIGGLIGCGFFASNHLNGWRDVSGARIAALCDQDEAKLSAAGEKPWHNIQESVVAIQQHFIACLSAGQPPETSVADNLKTLELVEAAYRSASEGRMVDIDTL